MRKKWITISVLLLLCIAVGFSIWYHLPIHKTASMTVCTPDGETAQLEVDIKIHRRFFKESIIRGSVTLDGVKYLDGMTSFHVSDAPDSIATRESRMCFYKDVHPITSTDDTFEKFNNMIQLHYCDVYNFEQVWLEKRIDGENCVMYLGPAETTAEAEAVEHAIFGEDVTWG